jgi:hypothetical protein
MSVTTNNITGGAWQDTQGNILADGYLLFELSQDCIVNSTTMVCAGFAIQVPLNASGSVVSSPLWPVDLITPRYPTLPLFYTVTAYSAAGQKVWGPYSQSIKSTPSPFDLGALIPGKV